MTIAQRIELRRLGYTKEEITEMIEQENTVSIPVENEEITEDSVVNSVETVNEQAAPQPTTADLLTAINNLTTALQMQRIATTPQPETAVKPQTATDIFNDILKG